VVYFVDAAHFVFNCYLGFLWCFSRVFVRAPSGRQRWNVLGALNAITHELLTITNETYITSEEVCALLRKIAVAHIDQVITVILDNARYQRCAKVQDCARMLGIELLFLPPYSPNFNLIERLWGFVKDTCLYSKYYTTFADFKQSISICLSETNGKHKQQLKTLLTLKFQSFKNVKL
jgi:transposase